ncbi:MAG: endopeptidase La [Bacteroidetes bacterium]|nr:endopeptidase La [Bacteroidota bacterium]
MFNQESEFIFSGEIDERAEIIPLIEEHDGNGKQDTPLPDDLPILPLRNTVLFPGVVIPITVGRKKSISLIQDVYEKSKTIGVLAQKNVNTEDPVQQDIYTLGTVAHILRVLQMPDGTTTAIIQGKKRFQIKEIIQSEPFFKATFTTLEEVPADDKVPEMKALLDSLKDLSLQIIKLSPNIPNEAGFAIKNIENTTFLVNFICNNMNAEVNEKQQMLEAVDIKERAVLALKFLTRELQSLELRTQIQTKVKSDIDKQQREYILQQQMKQIQDELGVSPAEHDLKELEEKAKKKKWNEQVAKTVEKEISKLRRIHPNAAEYGLQMNYVDILVELPWNEFTDDVFDLKRAEKILNKDHYGLEKVKERILEHLAVLKLKGDMKSPILCFVGPPGTGKTSLGQSIARSLGRKYIRVSLGGLHDEAEIRGHRKTYIGAMPGRIIQGLKKAKSSNPVFVLDEIDKVGADYHGDPSAALLEVLDPEQNNAFHDNYLDIDYDLSKVMFIATANTLTTVIPALRDRMEVIDISGYVVEEKVEIAKRHLLPRLLRDHGLKKSTQLITDEALVYIINDYTFESGVRGLEKNLAKVIRYVARKKAGKEEFILPVQKDNLISILRVPHSHERFQVTDMPGVVPGLAWTPAGGDILFVEVSLSRGKGKLTLTGSMGEIMKESATLALQYLKAHAKDLALKPKDFENWNIHIHIPEGATPKDGPSAGITMYTALASAFTRRKVKPYLAMTGEITLRGKILPVGGIKEKILAAKRAGIHEVILPEENKKDVDEINKEFLKELAFTYVKNMIEVTSLSLGDESKSGNTA